MFRNLRPNQDLTSCGPAEPKEMEILQAELNRLKSSLNQKEQVHSELMSQMLSLEKDHRVRSDWERKHPFRAFNLTGL